VSPCVAVVGAGAWGKNHVRAFHALGSLGGVVEASSSLRAKLQGEYPGLPVWSSLEMAFPHVQGIVIATPAVSHAPLAAQALEAGLGVLVEKPMTLDAAQAQGLVATASSAGRTLMVGHLLLYQSAIQDLKRQLDAGVVGKVLRIDQERLNHGRVRPQENVLWSFAPHDVAVLFYLMGQAPTAVQACGAAFLQEGIPDDVHLELAFPGGRSAHIHAAWYWPEKRRGLRVLGEEGMVVYDEADQSITLHRKRLKGGGGQDRLEPLDRGSVLLHLGQGEALLREDQHFLDCLHSNARPISDGQSGADVIRVLERADAQLKQGPQPLSKEQP
jgi:predicted dehydrogenase